jgi:hypothetical protein
MTANRTFFLGALSKVFKVMTHALLLLEPGQLFLYVFPGFLHVHFSPSLRCEAAPPQGVWSSQLQPSDQALDWTQAWRRITLVVLLFSCIMQLSQSKLHND